MDGEVEPTSYNIFVDDNPIAVVTELILQAITVNMGALFLVTGPEEPDLQRSNISMNIFSSKIFSGRRTT